MNFIISIMFIFLFLLLTAVTISWFILSHSIYTQELLKPGEPYKLCGKDYILSNIPIEGNAYKIKDKVAESLRSLLTKTGKFLDRTGVEWWVTGGTLLGVERHGVVLMPWDDDVDIAVKFANRDYMFSDEFAEEALNYNLDMFTLVTNTPKSADRHGGVVRVQHFGGEDSNRYESLDIFFWKDSIDDPENKICKLDGWRRDGSVIENTEEKFLKSDLFPINRITCDSVDVCVPRNPRALLEKQYGKSVWDSIRPRPILIAHAFPIRFLFLLFVRGSLRHRSFFVRKKRVNLTTPSSTSTYTTFNTTKTNTNRNVDLDSVFYSAAD